MRRFAYAWLVLGVLLGAALLPLAAMGADTEFGKEFFQTRMTSFDFLQKIKLYHYYDSEGWGWFDVVRPLPDGIIIEVHCCPRVRIYTNYDPTRTIAMVLEVGTLEFGPGGLKIKDQWGTEHNVPVVRLETESFSYSAAEGTEVLGHLLRLMENSGFAGGSIMYTLLPQWVYVRTAPSEGPGDRPIEALMIGVKIIDAHVEPRPRTPRLPTVPVPDGRG